MVLRIEMKTMMTTLTMPSSSMEEIPELKPEVEPAKTTIPPLEVISGVTSELKPTMAPPEVKPEMTLEEEVARTSETPILAPTAAGNPREVVLGGKYASTELSPRSQTSVVTPTRAPP